MAITIIGIGVRRAEGAFERARVAIGSVLDEIQMRLKAFAASNDPDLRLWAEEMRKAVSDGSIQREIEQQPDPAEIVERWRSSEDS
jgi:hypothetical protein